MGGDPSFFSTEFNPRALFAEILGFINTGDENYKKLKSDKLEKLDNLKVVPINLRAKERVEGIFQNISTEDKKEQSLDSFCNRTFEKSKFYIEAMINLTAKFPEYRQTVLEKHENSFRENLIKGGFYDELQKKSKLDDKDMSDFCKVVVQEIFNKGIESINNKRSVERDRIESISENKTPMPFSPGDKNDPLPTQKSTPTRLKL